jgi:hypothetical protein
LKFSDLKTEDPMRVRYSAVFVMGLVLAAMVLRPAHPETASPTVAQLAADLAALQTRVTTLEGTVSGLQTTVSAQAAQIVSLQGAVASVQNVQIDLQNKLQFVTVSGTEMYVTGANLNIRNGLGATYAEPNGLGNLVVGYNEINPVEPSLSPKSGSHNIVVGYYHGYSSYGGLVSGWANRISAPNTSVSGGFANIASAPMASVSGGSGNTASKDGASVSGGSGNTASGIAASVSGGSENTASGIAASVSGGASLIQGSDLGWSGGAFHTP